MLMLVCLRSRQVFLSPPSPPIHRLGRIGSQNISHFEMFALHGFALDIVNVVTYNFSSAWRLTKRHALHAPLLLCAPVPCSGHI